MKERNRIFRGLLLWGGVVLAAIGFFAAAGVNAENVMPQGIGMKKTAEPLWSENFSEASARAKETKKPMLLYFTGSDWCGWCKKLHAEVLDRPEFMKWADENVVLFKADFPEEIEQSRELRYQNGLLARQYRVSGYPTVILADSDGRVIARTGYQSGGASAYVKHLESLLKK